VVDERLLEVLACPVCKSRVSLVDSGLVCESCGRRYPIRNGIPIMLVDEATLPDEQQEKSD